ncbi:hypothetical protein KY363_04170, partial [Candidatus Woesearchaeota archaeon]|nr:hypothetical protein [Candidatus Woesearchaeota archaeon]
ISHSLVIWAVVIILVAMFLRRWPVFMFAGVISILMDIPTHTDDFLPTPFLWPLSDFRFPGISWGSWWFMVLNYAVLAIGYTYFFVYQPCIDGRMKLGARWQRLCRFLRGKKGQHKKTEKN